MHAPMMNPCMYVMRICVYIYVYIQTNNDKEADDMDERQNKKQKTLHKLDACTHFMCPATHPSTAQIKPAE